VETFLFGPDDRLFGAYYEGLGPPTAPAVLICNALGQEYMRTQIVLRHLARQLSAAGGPVLQFDYRGCGDSWGDPGTNRLDDLREDAATALQELLDISGSPRAVTVGVRFGAWLALELCDRVVAWDPILSGAGYVSALRDLSREVYADLNHFPVQRRYENDDDPELVGYRYAGTLLDELSAMDLDRVAGQKRFDRLALVSGADASDREAVAEVLAGRTDSLEHFTANTAKWTSAWHIENSITPFPSLAELCATVTRW
jgi:alpha/beta superfamily hydrolase